MVESYRGGEVLKGEWSECDNGFISGAGSWDGIGLRLTECKASASGFSWGYPFGLFQYFECFTEGDAANTESFGKFTFTLEGTGVDF